jgi:hypothetical protein
MLLTITTTYQPATDLGYLLYKNPARVHDFNLTFGRAHVFYPEATEARCTAALIVEVDPIGLVRGRRGPAGEGRTLQQTLATRLNLQGIDLRERANVKKVPNGRLEGLDPGETRFGDFRLGLKKSLK